MISLAEAKETVSHAPTSSLFDERAQSQFKTVLDFVEDQLAFVPHSRREAMTLGDFLSRHTYTNGGGSSREPFLAQVLRNKISEVLGEHQVDINAAEVIDWEYVGVRTNPHIHEQEDLKTKAALAEGKGYNLEATSEAYVDGQLTGKGIDMLGESASVTLFDTDGNPYEVERY